MKTFKPYMLINNTEQELKLFRIDCSQQIAPDNYHIYTKNGWIEVFAGEGHATTGGPPSRRMKISASGFAAEYLTLLAAEIGDEKGSVLLRSREGDLIDITFRWLSSYLSLYGEFMIKEKGVSIDLRVALPEGKEITGYGSQQGTSRRREFYIEEMSHSDRIALIRAVAEHKDLVLEQIIQQ